MISFVVVPIFCGKTITFSDQIFAFGIKVDYDLHSNSFDESVNFTFNFFLLLLRTFVPLSPMAPCLPLDMRNRSDGQH